MGDFPLLLGPYPLPILSWVRYPVGQHTFVSPSAFSRRAVVSYWRKYVHEVLVNRLGGLSLPRKSVVRLTDRPDMTLDVYRGRKTTKQPTNPAYILEICIGVVWKTYEIPRPPGAKKVNETPVCIHLNQIIINVSEQ